MSGDTLVLHLTDLHFGDIPSESFSVPDFNFKDIGKLIAKTIRTDYTLNKIIIAIGGDITNKGVGLKYQYAHSFLQTIESELQDYHLEYILCPGNHDIQTDKDNWFNNFNKFSAELTKNEKFLYSKKVSTISSKLMGWYFICTNSLFHGDHRYGLIDITSVERELKKADGNIILLTHHHLIPIEKEDISATRNSYDFMRLCLEFKVKLIIHGHIHSSFRMDYCTKDHSVTILGCGATLPAISTNYNNQFNIIIVNEAGISNISTYRIVYNSSTSYKPDTIKTTLTYGNPN